MGLTAEAERLEAAVARVYREGKTLTPDQGGRASTRDVGRAVMEAYRNQ
jgi:isocitrate/isopropylmalate dehydrogenase